MEQKNYWFIHLGKANKFVELALQKGCVAVSWKELDVDLNHYLNLPRKEFVKSVGLLLRKAYPDRPTGYIRSAVGQLFRFASVMQIGDVVLMPSPETDKVYTGVIKSEYRHAVKEANFPFAHQREVEWLPQPFSKEAFPEKFRKFAAVRLTLYSANEYAFEIDKLIHGSAIPEGVEDIVEFGTEKLLEDFLMENWGKLPIGKKYDLYTEDGKSGRQYPTDAGRIDILARSKDKKQWLVVELKRGRTGSEAVGQLLGYVGYIKKHMARNGEAVKGLLIGSKEEKDIGYAMAGQADISFIPYSLQFKLEQNSHGF